MININMIYYHRIINIISLTGIINHISCDNNLKFHSVVSEGLSRRERLTKWAKDHWFWNINHKVYSIYGFTYNRVKRAEMTFWEDFTKPIYFIIQFLEELVDMPRVRFWILQHKPQDETNQNERNVIYYSLRYTPLIRDQLCVGNEKTVIVIALFNHIFIWYKTKVFVLCVRHA